MTKTTLCVAAVLLVAGCGGTTYVNKQYRSQLAGSASNLVIMPTEAHRFPKGLRPALEKLMNDEIEQAFGAAGVKVMPVQGLLFGAGFGNLGWRLALGMYRQAASKGNPKLEGDYYDWLDELPEEAVKFRAWIAPALQKAGAAAPTAKPRYILAAYLDRFRGGKDKAGKPVIHVRVMVGVFDVEKQRIVACHWSQHVTAPTLEKLRPLLTGFGARARQQLGPVF